MNAQKIHALVVCMVFVPGCVDPPENTYERRDAGQPHPPVGDFCAERCATTSDCLSGYTCTGNRCQPPSTGTCTTHGQCQVQESGWGPECNGDNYCAVTHVCIKVDNKGWCAQKPSYVSPCTQALPEMQMPHFATGESVTVCGNPRMRCGAGVCFVGCASDADCGGEYPACNTVTGVCQCTSTSCHTNASTCESGKCRCMRDQDCTVAADKCFEGVCGCSSSQVCPSTTVHPNTRWVCE